MTFLSGVFYSIHSLPPFWQGVSHLNPFFYMIDGFRYGFFGASDVSPWLSLSIVGFVLAVVSAIADIPAAHGLQNPRLTPTEERCHDCRRTQIHHRRPACNCEHCELEGDGRHWYATIVSPEFEGKRPLHVTSACTCHARCQNAHGRGACPVHENLHARRMGSPLSPIQCTEERLEKNLWISY
jgi:stress-induced morphogen